MKTAHLETLFQLSSDLLCVINHEGRFIKVNQTFKDLLGYTDAELNQKPYTHFIHPDDQEHTFQQAQRLLRGVPVAAYENRYLTREGRYVWLCWTSSTIVDGMLCAAARDVTSLKEAKQTIMDSEKKFRSLVQNGYEIISIVAENGTYAYHSDSIYRVLGYLPEELIGVSALAIVHPEDVEKVVNGTIQLKNSSYVNNGIPYRVKAKDGTYKWLESSGTNMTDDPLIGGIVVNSRDITEKIQLTEQLRQQEAQKQQEIALSILKAEEKERARIGLELHDNINQRLTAAQLYLEHMQSDEQSRTTLLRKTQAVLHSTIQEIRRLSHGMVLTGLEDLQGAVKELAEDLLSPSRTQFQLNMMCTREYPTAFKTALYRMIQAQMTNIAKYAEANLVAVSLRREKGYIELMISDNGKGFDPLQKTLGIGLAGISSRAHVFGGEVAVDAAPAKGCRLRIRFPEDDIAKTMAQIQ